MSDDYKEKWEKLKLHFEDYKNYLNKFLEDLIVKGLSQTIQQEVRLRIGEVSSILNRMREIELEREERFLDYSIRGD